jgi:hypothetical protein
MTRITDGESVELGFYRKGLTDLGIGSRHPVELSDIMGNPYKTQAMSAA